MVVDTTDARRRVKELQEKTGSLAERDCSRRRQEKGSKIESLLPGQSPVEWPPIPEKTCRGYGMVVEKLYSIFMSEPLPNLHLGVSRLFETCLI